MVVGIFASPREIMALWRGDRRALLHEFLLIFLAAGFVVAPEPLWSDLFFIFLVPLALVLAWRYRAELSLAAMPAYLKAGCLLILWFTLTLAWDPTAQARPAMLVNWFWNCLCTLIFVLILADGLARTMAWRERLMRGLILAAAGNEMISFIRLPFNPENWWSGVLRMGGWAETRHQILGAVIIGIIVLMALARAVQTRDRRYWAAAFAGLAFIALTGSRGPEGAVAVAVAVLLGASQPKALAALVLAGLAVFGVFALLDWSLLSHMVTSQLARGDSNRMLLWSLSWEHIQLSPWIGHGPAYRLPRDYDAFPHNLWLSTWLYTGLVGVMILLAYLALVLRRCFFAENRAGVALNLAILVHVMLCAVTDFSQVVKGPGAMWYMFWLSTLFCARGTITPADASPAAPAARPAR